MILSASAKATLFRWEWIRDASFRAVQRTFPRLVDAASNSYLPPSILFADPCVPTPVTHAVRRESCTGTRYGFVPRCSRRR